MTFNQPEIGPIPPVVMGFSDEIKIILQTLGQKPAFTNSGA
jgi:hypothetical protein